MLLLAAFQLNMLKHAKNHHFSSTEINDRVGDGTYLYLYCVHKNTFVHWATAAISLKQISHFGEFLGTSRKNDDPLVPPNLIWNPTFNCE